MKKPKKRKSSSRPERAASRAGSAASLDLKRIAATVSAQASGPARSKSPARSSPTPGYGRQAGKPSAASSDLRRAAQQVQGLRPASANQVRSGGKRGPGAVARVYSRDDRQSLLLLLTPVVLMAIAIAASHSLQPKRGQPGAGLDMARLSQPELTLPSPPLPVPAVPRLETPAPMALAPPPVIAKAPDSAFEPSVVQRSAPDQPAAPPAVLAPARPDVAWSTPDVPALAEPAAQPAPGAADPTRMASLELPAPGKQPTVSLGAPEASVPEPSVAASPVFGPRTGPETGPVIVPTEQTSAPPRELLRADRLESSSAWPDPLPLTTAAPAVVGDAKAVAAPVFSEIAPSEIAPAVVAREPLLDAPVQLALATPLPSIDVKPVEPALPAIAPSLAMSAPPTVTAPLIPAPLAIPPQAVDDHVCLAKPVSPAGAVHVRSRQASLSPQIRMPRPADPAAFGRELAAAARAQTADFVLYTARYEHLAYPMGDVAPLYGACTDVVIRAYRTLGIDLQELVQTTHSGHGDASIDHRRTETLRGFFARFGESLPPSDYPEDYKPGDIVTYYRPFSRVSRAHIAVVSDKLAPTGRPYMVHNRGYGPQLEDALFVDRITGHYRFDAAKLVPPDTEGPVGHTGPSGDLVSSGKPAKPAPRQLLVAARSGLPSATLGAADAVVSGPTSAQRPRQRVR